MTNTSVGHLQAFLEAHQQSFFPKMRIADYGGTHQIGGGVVQKMLKRGKLTDYHMLDFDNGVDLRKPIKGKKFDLGICMDLLEHVSNPWVVAQNIQNSLKSGSLLFVTAPFVWEMHGYPNDYWRFTPAGLIELFTEMETEIAYAVLDPHVDADLRDVGLTEVPVSRPWSRVIAVFKKK